MSTTGPKINVVDSIPDGATYGDDGRAFLRMFQALIQANVINMTTSTPPGSPGNGDTYVVDPTGSGVWLGKNNYIAYWSTDNPNVPSGEWEFYQPLTGWIVGNRADQTPYIFNGSSWVAVGGGGGGGFSTQTTTISAAQLKTLSSVPITVLTSSGAGTLNIPVVYLVQMKFGTVQFNGTATYTFGVPSGIPSGSFSFDDLSNAMINSATSQIHFPFTQLVGYTPQADLAGQNYKFFVSAGSDPTLGDGTVVVTVKYLTITLL